MSNPIKSPWPNTYEVVTPNGDREVVLYHTTIVIWPKGESRHLILCTGDHNTPLTRRRINQVLKAWEIPLKVAAQDFRESCVRHVYQNEQSVWVMSPAGT